MAKLIHLNRRINSRLNYPFYLQNHSNVINPPENNDNSDDNISVIFGFDYRAFALIKNCETVQYQSEKVANCFELTHKSAESVKNCHGFSVTEMAHLAHCADANIKPAEALQSCLSVEVEPFDLLKSCVNGLSKAFGSVASCQDVAIALNAFLNSCQSASNHHAVAIKDCVGVNQSAIENLKSCQNFFIKPALNPICWHEIKLEDDTTERGVCSPRPPSDRLPFHLRRKRFRGEFFPFYLSCWNEQKNQENQSIIRKSYMIYNEISARVAGQKIELMSLKITTDTGGYCWQFDATIAPQSFAIIEALPNEKRIIEIKINDLEFHFLIEDWRINRKFLGNSYSLTGRSKTAHLGADYAKNRHISFENERYARQIAEAQLEFLDFTIAEWATVDWLIPEHQNNGAPPIAIIQELAQVAGGFVVSHPFKNELSIRPIFKNPAWAQGDPDFSVPSSLILSVSEQRRIAPFAEIVRVVMGSQGANVYRSGTAQIIEAPTVSSPLLTTVEVQRSAGIKALSDTGNHIQASVELPISRKHNLPLAELGAIWRFEDSWQGVITGVSLSVELSDGVPVIKQTLDIDRFLGEER